jgi:hypothetical protein
MADSKDHIDISPSNIIKPALENLSADEQQRFQDYMNKVQEEATMKYLAHFTMDRHQKIVKEGEIEMSSLLPSSQKPHVSKTDDIQSLIHYIDEQRNQLKQYMGSTEEDFRKMKCAFEISTIHNFPSHDIDVVATTHNSSAIRGIHKPSHLMVCR